MEQPNEIDDKESHVNVDIVAYMEALEQKFQHLKLAEEKVKCIAKKTSSQFKNLKKKVKLSEKIATQIEYYFCDDNLKNDLFMIGQLKKSKDGYVNLKTIANFKKIKKLSKKINFIRNAIKQFSIDLVLNSKQTMIRRKVPFVIGDEFTLWIESSIVFSRTGDKTIYDIYKSASKIDKILHFQILNENETLKAKKIIESLKLNKDKEFKEENIKQNLYSTLSACNGNSILIVYENKNSAKKAVDMLSEVNINWRFGMKVFGFTKPLSKPTKINQSSPATTATTTTNNNNDKPQKGSVVHAILSEKSASNINNRGKRYNRLKGRGSLAALLGEQESSNNSSKDNKSKKKRSKLFKNTKSGSLLDIVGLSNDNISVPIKISKAPDGTRGFDSVYQKKRGAIKQFSAGAIEWVPS